MADLSVLTIGDVEGNLKAAFEYAATKYKKLNFSVGFIAGNLFANPDSQTDENESELHDLLAGKIAIPFPIYFTAGTWDLPLQVIERLSAQDDELCPNLYFLGRTATTTIDGLRIVALGGVCMDDSATALPADTLSASMRASRSAVGTHQSVTNTDEHAHIPAPIERPSGSSSDVHAHVYDHPGLIPGKYARAYSEHDALVLIGDGKPVDFLLTTEWPRNVLKGTESSEDTRFPQGNQAIADICTALKPRYHLSSSKFYASPKAFCHPPSAIPNANGGYPPTARTRFLSLAPFVNDCEQTSRYAFRLDLSKSSHEMPSHSHPRPFPLSMPYVHKKRKARTEMRRPRAMEKKDCYLCLANSTSDHMVVSASEFAYMTVARGPLSQQDTYDNLGLRGHAQIVPINHIPHVSAEPDDDRRAKTSENMVQYREGLNEMLLQRTGTELGSVTMEIVRHENKHALWQYLPFPAKKIRNGTVASAFRYASNHEKWGRMEKGAKEDGQDTADCFNVWLWAPAAGTATQVCQKLTLPLDRVVNFNALFGRRVMAKLLGLEARVVWQTCQQSEEEETADADALRAAFAPFEPAWE